MTYVTRDLLSHSLSRGAGELVKLIFVSSVLRDDGSFATMPNEVPILARVVDLQPREIQRLFERGITMHKGISVSVPKEYSNNPDRVIRADGTIAKVVDYTISENGAVLLCDVPALGST